MAARRRPLPWESIGTVALGEGLEVRRVEFGGAWLTGPGTFGPPPDLAAARQTVSGAVAAGVQSAAEALHPYPDDVVVREGSLRRLRLEAVALFAATALLVAAGLPAWPLSLVATVAVLLWLVRRSYASHRGAG